MPTNHVSTAMIRAIGRLVAIVLAQGCQPLRMRPTGIRCCNRNRYAGPTPNMTS